VEDGAAAVVLAEKYCPYGGRVEPGVGGSAAGEIERLLGAVEEGGEEAREIVELGPQVVGRPLRGGLGPPAVELGVVRFLHQVKELVRRHHLYGFLEALVAAGGEVVLEEHEARASKGCAG